MKSFIEIEQSPCMNPMCGSVIKIIVTKSDGVAVVCEVIGTKKQEPY